MALALQGQPALSISFNEVGSYAAAAGESGQDVHFDLADGGQPGASDGHGGSFFLEPGTGADAFGAFDAGYGGSQSYAAGAGGSSAVVGRAPGGGGGTRLWGGDGGSYNAGGAGTAGADGGDISIIAGYGGSTNSTGAHPGGAGNTLDLQAGTGGNATDGTGDGGAGASVNLKPGEGGTSFGGAAGVPGMVKIAIGGTPGIAPFALSTVRNVIANAATITAAQMRAHVLFQDATAAAADVSMTTRTGAQLAADLPAMAVGNAVPIYHSSNDAVFTSTIVAGAGVTLVGFGAVIRTGGQYLLIKTGGATFDLVRVG
jgi:hypothetical protein